MINEILVAGLLLLPTIDRDDAEPFLLQEATCLAKNMYYESRNQGTAGKLAVSNVVLNRVTIVMLLKSILFQSSHNRGISFK